MLRFGRKKKADEPSLPPAPDGARRASSDVNGDPSAEAGAGAGASASGDLAKGVKRAASKDKWRDVVIGQPSNFQHALHVGQNFEWTGQGKPGEDFRFVQKLGEGSYGTAYRAVHQAQRFDVAIKVVMLAPSTTENAKLQKELDILKACRDPHVVAFFGCCFVDADMWILMEFCGGGSLRDVLDRMEGGLKERYVAAVCADTVQGLAYLHRSSIVHNDIKASNILLTDDGVAKIADFGVSEQLSQTVLGGRGLVGTPYWMAPEVITQQKSDFRSDIWSMGITAIELAEGFPPYVQLSPMLAMRMIPHKPAPTLTDKRKSKWSKHFHDFLAKCLDKDPAKRATAEQLLQHPFIKKGVKSSKNDLKKLLQKTASLRVPTSDNLVPVGVPGFEGDATIPWRKSRKGKDPETGSTDSSGSSVDEAIEGREPSGTFIARPNVASLFMFRSRSRDMKSVGTQTEPPSFWTRLAYAFAGCCSRPPLSQLDIEEQRQRDSEMPGVLRRHRQGDMFTETDPLLR